MSGLAAFLMFRALERAVDATQPRAEVYTPHHKVRDRLEVDGERIKVDWMHIKPPRGDSENALWFFHGAGSEENAWYEPGMLASKEWLAVEELLNPYPHVFCMSFSKLWCISKTKDRRYGERDAFVDSVEAIIHHVEKQYLPNGPKKRIGVGTSMGGFNLLQMFTHRPNLWNGICLQNPMLKDYTQPEKVMADYLIEREFGRRDWDEQMPNNPQNMALVTKDHPRVHMQIAKHDEFGFQIPGRKYYEDLLAKGVNITLRENTAGHHDLDDVLAASFINDVLKDPPPPAENHEQPKEEEAENKEQGESEKPQ